MKTVLQKSMIKCIAHEMDRFNVFYEKSLKSNVKLINTVINYISKRKGKQLRPALCILSANLCGKPNDESKGDAFTGH